MFSSIVPVKLPVPGGEKVKGYALVLFAGTDKSLGPQKPLPVRVAVALNGASVVLIRGISCSTYTFMSSSGCT